MILKKGEYGIMNFGDTMEDVQMQQLLIYKGMQVKSISVEVENYNRKSIEDLTDAPHVVILGGIASIDMKTQKDAHNLIKLIQIALTTDIDVDQALSDLQKIGEEIFFQ